MADVNSMIEGLKTGFITGKNAFEPDDERAEIFDTTMHTIIDAVRADAYVRFRAMMDSELDEAVRHVRELTWNECCEAVGDQGTVQLPENPYTREAVARQQAEQNETDNE